MFQFSIGSHLYYTIRPIKLFNLKGAFNFYLDVADSSIIEQFGEYKNRFIQELTEEKFNCAKRIVCEWTSREDPDVQENIMMW